MPDLNFFLYSIPYFTIKGTIGILVRGPRPKQKSLNTIQHKQLHLSNPSIFVYHWYCFYISFKLILMLLLFLHFKFLALYIIAL